MSKDLRHKDRNYDLVEDDRWKRKGVPHLQKKNEPEVCECKGQDPTCPICEGEGVVYE
jgi:hypothetical protein